MLSSLLINFLTRLLPDLSIYFIENRPVCFQAGGRRSRPNLALVFWVHGCVFAFVVFDLVFHY